MLHNTETMSVSTCKSNSVTNSINTWCIDKHIYQDKIIQHIDGVGDTRFLLDLTKNNYTLLEKFVYDSAIFHFSRLNIHDMENYYIEFWCKSKFHTHHLHVDCDESLRQTGKYIYPLLSCVTYFNDVPSCPTIITNVDMDCYKYKEFETQTEVILSLPVHNKQITFGGNFFHGSTSLFDNQHMDERHIIAINFWKSKPLDVEYYNKSNLDSINTFERIPPIVSIRTDDNIGSVNVDNNIINYNLFNDILYNKKCNVCYVFNELIQNYCHDNRNNINTFKFIIDHSISVKKKEMELKNKYGDIMDDYKAILDTTIDLKYNRFLQRFTYQKIYTPDICNYIVNECEKYATNNGGWTTTRHVNYPTTDLPVDKIPSIFGLILETFKTKTVLIRSSYGLHDDMVLDIKDLFVVKYSVDSQKSLEMHCDGSFISFSILLNNENEFEGGGTYFDDGLTSKLGQGDMLLHSSQIKHSGLPITKGKRYLLVGFVNIEL